jgi:hypothetical protein
MGFYIEVWPVTQPIEATQIAPNAIESIAQGFGKSFNHLFAVNE